ncbi:ribosomal protein S6 kinase beta-like isoform X1 [Ostrinia furnacalis]|uniref:ribosomal protein S6 kinase beta-like isoform X1 n=1 Tax=Ostrinia furnacalis TaxID=93504 RepID=UPI00103A046B|nr:ribosomal protein S6 kinase beta-like isoform X1 [Ostrinia furnacalis]
MDSPFLDSKNSDLMSVRTSTSSNQLFIAESSDLPDDAFRTSVDNISVIGENVTVGDRNLSIDSSLLSPNVGTPVIDITTPLQTPVPETPPLDNSLPITETPKVDEINKSETRRPENLLILSLTKKNENDIFVKPSPVAEVMSPARMLQFEVDLANSATPTMKRAAIDFDFFSKNKFEEYFDEDEKPTVVVEREPEQSTEDKVFEETPVIVKPDTVRHEIGFVNLNGASKVDISHFDLLKVLGTGAYGKVFLVRKRCGVDEGKLYAMKVLKKASIVQKLKTAEHTRTERQVLEAVRACPFLVTLHYAFQTDAKLHLILGKCF